MRDVNPNYLPLGNALWEDDQIMGSTRGIGVMVMWVSLVLGSGCGTLATRGGREHFGAYPYQGVGEDVIAFSKVPKVVVDPEGIPEFILLVVSLPFDVVFDTVLLPVDAIWWLRGKEKDGWFSGVQ